MTTKIRFFALKSKKEKVLDFSPTFLLGLLFTNRPVDPGSSVGTS